MPRVPSPAPLSHRYGSIEDGAAYLGVHPRSIRRMIAEGVITGYRFGARAIRIDLNELDATLSTIPTRGA